MKASEVYYEIVKLQMV